MRPIAFAAVPTTLLVLAACYPALPEVAEPCATWEEPGTYSYNFDYGDKKRRALVYMPATEGPRQMVLGLHGAGSNGADFGSRTGFYNQARRQGFVLTAPTGLGWRNAWNAGTCCGQPEQWSVDDVGYLDRLASDLMEKVCVDTIFVVGASNGAMMAQRYGCEGEHADAVVSSAGWLETRTCGEDGAEPVPVRMYHGTDDAIVPIDGGDGVKGGDFSGSDFTLAAWRARNQCTDAEPETFTSGTATCESYDCAAETILCTIEGHGHGWPGTEDDGAPDATAESWEWLQSLFPAGSDGEDTDTDEPQDTDAPEDTDA